MEKKVILKVIKKRDAVKKFIKIFFMEYSNLQLECKD